jgi:hypothetical protein
MCSATYGLYNDYYKRKIFKKEFMTTKIIENKQLLIGNVSCNNSSTSDIICSRDIYKKEHVKYYDYYFTDHINQNKLSLPSNLVKIYVFWKKNKNFNYIHPLIMFNNFQVILNKKTVIYHTNKNLKIISHNKYQIEKSIPNNTNVAIFAENKDNMLITEYIGKPSAVISEIKYRYYGISNVNTLITLSLFGISAYYFFTSITKN